MHGQIDVRLGGPAKGDPENATKERQLPKPTRSRESRGAPGGNAERQRRRDRDVRGPRAALEIAHFGPSGKVLFGCRVGAGGGSRRTNQQETIRFAQAKGPHRNFGSPRMTIPTMRPRSWSAASQLGPTFSTAEHSFVARLSEGRERAFYRLRNIRAVSDGIGSQPNARAPITFIIGLNYYRPMLRGPSSREELPNFHPPPPFGNPLE